LTTHLIIGSTLSANVSRFALLAILYVMVSVYLYHIVRSRELITRITGIRKSDSLTVFSLVKITGFILFGLLPYIILVTGLDDNFTNDFLKSGLSGQYWYIIPIIFIVITLLSFISARRKNRNKTFVKPKSVTHGSRFITASGWVLYILGYEFLFRGILWFACYEAFGFWAAIAVNIILYALAHLDKGYFMTIGAVPFGALLCYLTFLTGSFLFAFLIHSWLAVNNLFFPVYTDSDPEVGLKMKETRG
jgi:membrane protease YdiL (CAAX protease family)